jgi:hypothetical protein
MGVGWYWGVEIEAAQKYLGAEIRVLDLWVAKQKPCECHTFGFIPDLYQKRLDLEREEKTKGHPIKLGLNAMYGKQAQQHVGQAPYHDAAAAGLITAATRAQLIYALSLDPEAAIMVATDAIFSTRQLPLPISPKEVKALGLWSEETSKPDLFIVQSGVYWSPTNLAQLGMAGIAPSSFDGKLKSRGLAASVIGEYATKFEQVFNAWMDTLRQAGDRLPELLKRRQDIPAVAIKLRVFYGVRLALAWNKPWLAGTWNTNQKFLQRCAGRGVDSLTRYQSFDWDTKRDRFDIELRDRCIITRPMRGDDNHEGIYRLPAEFGKPSDADDAERMRTYTNIDGEEIGEDVALEGQPDWIDWLPEE